MMNILFELSYPKIMKKQKSITKLFPTFYQRVAKVTNNGGVDMDDMTATTWEFRVASGTKAGKKYDAYINWKGLPELIKKYGTNKRLWKKDESGIDLQKLAAEIIYNADLELFCSCPADLYWGSHYIRTQAGTKYTEPEDRAPNVRNPNQYGTMCKHLQALMGVLPMYVSTLAKYIKMFYIDDVAQVEMGQGITAKEKDTDTLKDKEARGKKKADLDKEKKELEDKVKHRNDLRKTALDLDKELQDKEDELRNIEAQKELEDKDAKESRTVGNLMRSFGGR